MLIAAAIAGGALCVGVAMEPIVPEGPLPLGGYTERQGAPSEPGGDRLACRAVAFRYGSQRIVVAVVDALTIPEGLADAVAEQAPPGAAVLLCATHTHCAPDSQMANPRMTLGIPGIADYDRPYARWLARRVGTAVRRALESADAPVARLELRTASAPFVRGRRPGAQPDRRVWALYADGRPVLASYSAHATLYGHEERKLRGDWPYALASRLGCAVAAGAVGDASPAAPGATPAEQAGAMAEGLAAALARALPVRVWSPGSAIGVHRVDRVLPASRPHPEFARDFRVPEALAAIAVRRFAPPSLRVAVLRLGTLRVLFAGAEPTGAVAARAERAVLQSGAQHARTVGHSGGWAGYVLEPRDYDAGGYEATLSFYGRDAADHLVAAARAAAQPLGPETARSLCGQSR
jgi:hypothetical protein